MSYVVRFLRAIGRIIATMCVLGLSLLPLSALLAALPAVSPNEAVLTETVSPARSRWRRLLRRIGGVFAGLIVLVSLFAFSVEVVSLLPLPSGSMSISTRSQLWSCSSTEKQKAICLGRFNSRKRP